MSAPQIRVILPTFHAGQVAVFRNRSRLNAVRCGRRFGKTLMMVTLAANAAAKGRKVGLFTPEHKQLFEPYQALRGILGDMLRQARSDVIIKTALGMPNGGPRLVTINGKPTEVRDGQIDFWSLNDNELAARGREYDIVMIDEAAWTKDSQMWGIWEKSIRPTMATKTNYAVWVFSTPNGIAGENFFWRICNDEKEKLNWREHYAPSASNPLVSAEYLEDQRTGNHPLVYQQEYLAEFVDFSGTAFFERSRLLVNDEPVPYPRVCDAVLAVIDTAVKTGQEHDATAVSYYAVLPAHHDAYKLVVLDWEIVQVEGAMLETWIPSVFARLEHLSKECRARFGSIGAYIEDAQSGAILLQQCTLRGWPAAALPAKLTMAGKDIRAINASGPVYRGEVKFSDIAYNKVMGYKGATRNHLWSQVVGFRVGDKDAARRADDLLDTFTYAVAITLGGEGGVA